MSNWEEAQPWVVSIAEVFGATLALVFMFAIVGMVN